MAIEKPSDRLFKYPPMERQDLNQTQLGSFKFTPVDNISSLQAIATSYMNNNINAILARVRTGAGPRSDRSVGPSAGNIDADFFNTHIKPDLGDSRLRLGPATFRSAVEGAATSPTRQKHKHSDQTDSDQLSAANASRFQNQDRYPLIQNGFPQCQAPIFMDNQSESLALSPTHRHQTFSRPHPENSLQASFPMHGAQYPNTNRRDSPFLSANPGAVSIGFPDPALINQSLTLALVNEQQGHEQTRIALHEETQKSIRLEEELGRCNGRIRKLQMRMKLMEDIPHQNTSGEFELKSANISNGFVEGVEQDVARLTQDSFGSVDGGDVVAHDSPQRPDLDTAVAISTHSNGEESGVGVAEEAAREVDDSQLFDLGALEGEGLEDSLDSNARRTLRKHFFINPQQDTITATPVQQTSNKLIEVSPDSNDSNADDAHSGDDKVSTLLSLFQDPPKRDKRELTITMSTSEAMRNLSLAEEPVLKLPAAFLAKYGKKPVKASKRKLKDGFHGFKSEKPKDEAKPDEGDTGEGNESDIRDGPEIPDTPSTTSNVSLSFVGEMPSEFPGQPMWKVHRDNPIFNDDYEKQRAKAFSGPPMDPTSQFYNHPVRYLPEDAVKNEDIYRTVMMNNIPLNTCANEILHIVYGGAVESIEMIDPIGKATSSMTARIVFVLEEGAMTMARSKGLKIDGVEVHCWLVREPTYPRSGEMEEFIGGILEASRILFINNITTEQYTNIQGVVMGLGVGRQLIGMSWEVDKCPEGFGRAVLEFTSIKAAVKAGQGIIRHVGYKQATLSFDEDYTCGN